MKVEKSDPCQSAGWLSPSGEWYVCAWLKHEKLAAVLSENIYSCSAGSKCLEKRGWIRVTVDGCLIMGESNNNIIPITSHQISTLLNIVNCSEGLYLHNIKRDIDWEIDRLKGLI